MAISSENKPNNNWDYKRWENYLINIYKFEDLEKELESCTNTIWSYINTEEEYIMSVWLINNEYNPSVLIKPDTQHSAYTQTLRALNISTNNITNYYYDCYNLSQYYPNAYIFSPHRPKYLYNYPDGTGNYPLSKEEYKNYIIEKWRKKYGPVPPPHR